ncbi:hypothetical protein [Thiothrix unzii]|jgi:hypothetical protein|uniref:hypothetical protein n=1 Tax=Thiothrix unzii TaxID=111769 RepID=UPI002A369D02|nr:hypothetical protein [Thiothrix unzii]MDX9990268.1 hypothetical protein [Thiothrix unzii]
MTINLDIVIETPEHSVDMKSGLDTLQGTSDAIRCISETILTEKTPQRLTHKGKVRTTLKQSFKGSYGHVFSIDIFDGALNRKFNRIGKETFSELISYFLLEALYIETQQLSDKAQKILDKIEDESEQLIAQLRVSALENIHSISTKFEHEVKIRFRRSRESQVVLAKFNKETAEVLQAIESNEKFDLNVCITRLNINTGNGRFLIKDNNETVAFGFGTEYKTIKLEAKKLFSENLNHNNGLQDKDWIFLRVAASPIKLRDGKIIKYIVRGFYRDK